jgi:hypothetical protein
MAERSGPTYADPHAAELLGPLLEQLASPAAAGWQCVKRSAARTVWRAQPGGQTLFVKHFHVPSWTYRVRKLLGLRESARELRASAMLRGAGVPAVRVLAAHEGPPEWCVCAGEEGVPADKWLRGAPSPDERRQALQAAAQTLGSMHAAGLVHPDLRLSNLLVCGRDEGLRVLLVDLHRVRREPLIPRRAIRRNLGRLMWETQREVSRADRLRFLLAYLRARRLGCNWRKWRRGLEAASASHGRRELRRLSRLPLRNGRYFGAVAINGWQARAVLEVRFAPGWSVLSGEVLTGRQWSAALSEWLSGGGAARGDGAITVGAAAVPIEVRRFRWRRRGRLRARLELSLAQREFVRAFSELAAYKDGSLPLALMQRLADGDTVEGLVLLERPGGLPRKQRVWTPDRVFS